MLSTYLAGQTSIRLGSSVEGGFTKMLSTYLAGHTSIRLGS